MTFWTYTSWAFIAIVWPVFGLAFVGDEPHLAHITVAVPLVLMAISLTIQVFGYRQLHAAERQYQHEVAMRMRDAMSVLQH